MALRDVGMLGLVLGLAACGESAPAGSVDAAQANAVNVEVVDLARLDGVLASHRGRAVVVNFWAMWCSPCVEELPDLMAAAAQQRPEDLTVLLVSYDLQIPDANAATIVPRVERFAAKRGIAHPVLVFDGDLDAINERFDLPGHVPVTLAIDRTGRIVDREDGPADRARFETLIRSARGG